MVSWSTSDALIFLCLFQLGVKGKINGLLKRGEKKAHFLDHAKGKYSEDMVEDTKGLLRILKIFIPIPIFWALFDQQGSRWTFQAVRTTGQLGSFIIKPDQMQVVNPLMILILIPIFDRFIYPQFGKWVDSWFIVTPIKLIDKHLEFLQDWIIQETYSANLCRRYPDWSCLLHFRIPRIGPEGMLDLLWYILASPGEKNFI